MPGVPPNALKQLKSMLKGMLRPGKRNKSTQQSPYQASSQNAAPAAAPAAPPSSSTSSPPDTNKSLPPVQSAPASEQPQAHEVQQNRETTEARDLQDVQGGQEISPVEPDANVGAVKSEPVSAVSQAEDEKLATPLKDDVAEEQPVTQETEAAESSNDQTTTNTETPIPEPVNENIRPNGAVTAPAADLPTAAAPTTKPVPIHYEDEKMPVMAEPPPPVKNIQTAPGMSATSGPLEDFPEGGPFPS